MDNHILVVEDDAAIREGVRILLEGEGYIVQEAEDGYQCLKKVSDDIDLVILDIMMPGISGIKTCEEIRKISHVPVLFLTAKSTSEFCCISSSAKSFDSVIFSALANRLSIVALGLEVPRSTLQKEDRKSVV